ncbi:MAG TPA: T9SS type A sorting domain-containing protein [Parafilimonas sp.]|nr:T9SS type A sorting domain-containing protein [Parafilimonas sp.]
MKKILLLTVLLITCYNLFAFTTQGVWRWRNDDGTETSATWRAEQNVAITVGSMDSILRLRVELYNQDGGFLDGALFEDSSDEVGGHWDTIKLAANSNAFVLAGSDAYVTDLEPTTSQLSGQALNFIAGRVMVSSDRIPNNTTVPQGYRTEYEYAFKPSPNIKPGVTYYFRIDYSDTTDGYIYPNLSTSSTLPVHLTDFKVSADKGRVLLQWTTTSETNNDHFDIERSTNGTAFTKIATVKGSGNSTDLHTYQAWDASPFNGMNFYRIKQVDADGKYSISDTRSVTMVLKNYFLQVYPNPVRSEINFVLQNYPGSQVTATLTNLNGKIIHEEMIQVSQSANTYKLNLRQKPAAGVYILQLRGEGLSENVKIVVQ